MRLERLFAADEYNQDEARLAVAFQICLDSRCMVRALGALLLYLNSQRIGVELDPLAASTPVHRICSTTV